MLLKPDRITVWSVLIVTIFGTLVPPLQAGDPFRFFGTAKARTATERLAFQIDQLEKELNKNGTVVIKAPDVWGESRLTKHRQEFESVMASQLNRFEFRFNAAIRRSDQAYLANALAIGNAFNPQGESRALDMTLVQNLTSAQTTSDSENGDSTSETPITRTQSFGLQGKAAGFELFKDQSISIEPTILLDQMKRYLDHLHEIRRINEGDDIADSPGYSLNLVRIPVSIRPGDKTRKGYGAEVTITATPHLTPELLPRVFRELVINDLVDALSLTTLKVAERIENYANEEGNTFRYLSADEQLLHLLSADPLIGEHRGDDDTTSVVPGSKSQPLPILPEQGSPRVPRLRAPSSETVRPIAHTAQAINIGESSNRKILLDNINRMMEKGGMTTVQAVPGSRNARAPVPASQMVHIFGHDELLVLGYEFWRRIFNQGNRSDPPHLMDARGFVQSELEAAYDYLSSSYGEGHWKSASEIVKEIFSGNLTRLEHRRENLHPLMPEMGAAFKPRERGSTMLGLVAPTPGTDSVPKPPTERIPTVTTALSWAVLVESALLNERLKQDIRRVSHDPDCNCWVNDDFQFYGPDPDATARSAFIDYVQCRWPIHVFALDPVVQEQNIADAYSMRREMQLALALAFANGQISAQNMTRFARRLEMDMETVALNRTHVGFGHANDTFGWQFYPRVQSPPFDSNSKVLFQQLLAGGPSKDHLRRNWEMEPGQRECVALILMPSFLEHVTFQARGRFFKLHDRDHTRSKMIDEVRWSEAVRSMEYCIDDVVQEADRYRFGEVERLLARVDQLAKELPLQTVHSRVPNENTIGGFEMFSSGITDLAPQLLDFYGEPGVHPGRETVVYLVGNHFSVHDTHVLAGNVSVPFKLISRQVMKVTIPPGVETVPENDDQSQMIVDVHVATPYGVSEHLDIPVIKSARENVVGYRWGRQKIDATYRVHYDSEKDAGSRYEIPLPAVKVSRPHELSIDTPNFVVPHPTASLTLVVVYNGSGVSTLVTQFNTNDTATKDIRFDRSTSRYTVNLEKYQALHQRLASAVKSYLEENFPNGDHPPKLNLTMNGAITLGGTDVPIQGSLQIHVVLVHR